MASPQMRIGAGTQAPVQKERRPVFRLLRVERSEEIFPVLLEEIVALGFPRALVSRVNFESSEITPVASLNCPKPFLQKFHSSLYLTESSLVRVLQSQQPTIYERKGRRGPSLYYHPLIFRNRVPCWESERRHGSACIAIENFARKRKLQLQEQVCVTCDMRAYAAVVVVEVDPSGAETRLRELRALIEFANQCLSRIFKVEHYYHRMTDMETTIKQMQTVMESMPDPVILTDSQHRVVTQNKAAERFFTITDEVSEGRIRAVELNNMLFSAALSSLAVSGMDGSRDITLVDVIEGEEVLFEAVSAPSLDSDGHGVGMVTVLRNLTDLRRADEELRANYERLSNAEELVRQDRDRLNLIIENVGDPIVVCDRDSKVVLLDPLAQELFGAEKSRSPIHVRNQTKLDAYVSKFTYSFSDRESAPLRLTHPATQQEIEYDVRSGKIYDERGLAAYSVSVLRDLSAVRRLEQLRMERRMLEMEKFAAAGRLAGTIAHEVNNPMEAIKNCIYLLTDQVKTEAVPIYDILKAETERVARIVRQMLGLYRTTEPVGNIDVKGLIEDSLLLFARQLERAGVRVEKDLIPAPPVIGSADQILQVFSNLIVNAKDSMSQGGVLHIRTRVVHQSELKEFVRIIIADCGSGIPKELLRTVFEPFVTTKGERGTGLGLWIVKGIIESHGGKVRVRSRVGRGTVFCVELPIVR